MDFLINWLSENYINLISIGGSSIAVIRLYLQLKSNKIKIPLYQIRSKLLDKMVKTQIALWNGGKDVITASDLPKKDELRIYIDQKINVIDSILVFRSNDEDINDIRIENLDNEIKINFDFLGFEDGGIIEVIHTGNFESISVKGSVMGVGKFHHRKSTKIDNYLFKVGIQSKGKNILIWITLILSIIVFIIHFLFSITFYLLIALVCLTLSFVFYYSKSPLPISFVKFYEAEQEELKNAAEMTFIERRLQLKMKTADKHSLIETKTADEIYEEELRRPIEDSAEEILEDVNESLNEEMENEGAERKNRTYPFSSNEIFKVIANYNFPHAYKYPLDNYLDFKFFYREKTYYIKLKPLLVSKVGLGTINTLKAYLTNERGEAWLIYKTDLTTLAIKAVAKFNALHEDIKIIPIQVGSVSEFENKFTQRLNLQKK